MMDYESLMAILPDYKLYLKDLGIKTYFFEGCLKIKTKLNDGVKSHIGMYTGGDSDVTVFDHCGYCTSDEESVNRIINSFRERFPSYEFEVEPDANNKIAMYRTIPYTTMDELHQEYCNIVDTMNQIIGMQEELGDEFTWYST